MTTVAEGIAQYGQFLALRRMACQLGQGYYFSRPVPAAQAEWLLHDLSRDSLPHGSHAVPAVHKGIIVDRRMPWAREIA